MKNILDAFYAKPLAVCLVAALLALSTFTGTAEAMFVPAAPVAGTGDSAGASFRAADLVKVRAALESKVVGQRLMDYGLSPDEAMARVNGLSDEQLHQLATHTDSLQAGGDAVGFVASAVVIALLVVLIIYLVQGRIVIR